MKVRRRRRAQGRRAARRSKPSSSKARRPARCWSRSRRPASATPTSSRCRAPIPKGCSRRSSATKARASCVEVGPGRDDAARRATTSSRSTRPNAASASPACRARPTSATAIRATQGKGLMPDGTSRFSLGRQADAHYMGARRSPTTRCCPRSRSRRSARTRRSTRSATSAAASPPASARYQHREGRAGRQRRGVRARRHRAERRAGRAHGRAPNMIVGVDLNPARERSPSNSA